MWGGGVQWLSDRVLFSRSRGCGFERHRRHEQDDISPESFQNNRFSVSFFLR